MDFLHTLLYTAVDYSIIIFEIIGVAILIVVGLSSVYKSIRQNPNTRLDLAKGMALALEFKLISEILRTIIITDFSELILVAGIVALRMALALLIHWEIKNEILHHQGDLQNIKEDIKKAEDQEK